MTSKARKILFWIFVIIFFLAAPTLVLYSQGYRVNWPPQPSQKMIVKTGGLFIKALPKQANLYINGDFIKKTDFFFGSTLVENLLPRTYKVELKKDNYQTWEKNLNIAEGQVTEAKQIILFPQSITPTIIARNILSFWISPNGQKIAIMANNNNGWEMELYETAQNVTSRLFSSDNLPKEASIKDLKWTDDSLSLNFQVAQNGQINYYSVNTENTPSIPIKTILAETAPIDALCSFKSEVDLFYINQNGFVVKKESLTSQTTQVSGDSLPVGKNSTCSLWLYNGYIFAKMDSDLYELAPNSKQFQKIFSDIASDIILSPDGAKIAWSSNSEIWVMYLKDKTDQPQKNAGDQVFIARMSKKISDLQWFNSDYLIFASGQEIRTAEIDNRDKINIAAIFTIAAPQNSNPLTIKWDSINKNLFIFDGSALFETPLAIE